MKIQEIEEDVPLPEKSDEEHQKDLKLFCDSIPLMLSQIDKILKKPEFFHIRLKDVLLGTIITGTSYIPIGQLLILWKAGKWIGICPECKSKVFVFMSAGSPLSGSHQYKDKG